MRILIAEDEMLERKAMRKFIYHNFPDVDIIGEAVNGRTAIEIALELTPDLILMDIKMPGVNGIEAIEQIHHKQPSIKFILISAYDSFDFAKQAMQLGVKEYILKPSKKEETIRAILRVKEELEKEREAIENQQRSEQIAQELLISKLMQFETGEEVHNLQQTLFPSMNAGFFLVVLPHDNAKAAILREKLNKLNSFRWIANDDEHHYILLFISEKKVTKADILKLARELHIALGDKAYIGAGKSYHNLADLPHSYLEAVKAATHLSTLQQKNYGFKEEKKQHATKKIEQLLTEVEMGNEKTSLYLLQDLMDDYSSNINEELVNLYYKLRQTLEQKGISVPEMTYKQLTSDKHWTEFIKLCCLNVKQHYQSQDKMERTKKYIHDHFDQPINLEELAQLNDLSTTYFSNLFKESTGYTLIDYITNVRLNKAKQLLQKNKYSLKEISYMIGYNDPNYFSRVFKKYYGVSPKQYQQAIIKM
ncbi:HTH-type transcriptional activator Btr [Paraliobacillus sp. PM-2]|uniref:response regulator n=1 Tax=Paraliobacillus sp. PM-2 TaxID=1462524 RepID=UPI00061C562C|nr:response regulator [Paraliobacillus sp. PM-2]CQR45944.1 HTH-type transcriptional activator Btr [Paraliobacillus sp. PM-2]